MKILYSWLKDYIEIDKTPEQLADDLSLFGHEVDSLEKIVNPERSRGSDDAVLDFEITPNRGDCLSILGMAREIAALYNSKIQMPDVKVAEDDLDKKIEVKISDPKICPRFTARIIDNIKIEPSPAWIQKRLKAFGFRPINNIVDITNYVMVATGQPLHAFDYDKISNGLFNIRLSKDGEEMMTLDGVNRKLREGIVIFEDGEKIFDLVGIMGGFKSEVSESTKTIVLMGSIFDAVLTRQSSKYLNHQTDASYRYERGVDFCGNIGGVDYAAKLIKDLNAGAKVGELIDQINLPQAKREIAYEPTRINRLLGTNLSDEEIKHNLDRLNFSVSDNVATVPSYRMFDIKIWQDLAEEVARIYGYNNLERNNLEKAAAKKNPEFIGTEKIKDELVNLGFSEIYSYSFTDKNKLNILGFKAEEQPQIAKPLSPETEYLRPSLIVSLLSAIARNPWSPDVNIFELEAVFSKDTESWQLGIATVGKNDALLKSAKEKLGLDGEILNVEQKILDAFKIRRPVKYLLCDVEKIKLPTGEYSLETSPNRYRAISKFPPTVRDLAFVVDSDVSSEKIVQTIYQIDENILLVELFDEFSSDKFGSNKKNVAYHVWLQDLKSAVSDDKAEPTFKKIIETVEKEYDAKLRA